MYMAVTDEYTFNPLRSEERSGRMWRTFAQHRGAPFSFRTHHPMSELQHRVEREQELWNELQEHNRNQVMVTYDRVSDQWVPWIRSVAICISL